MAVLGVAALTARHPWVATALRVGGGAFLLWMALGALRSALRPDPAPGGPAPGDPAPGDPAAVPRDRPGGVLAGLGLMMLNPKAGLFWVAVTGVFLAPGAPLALGLLAVAGAMLISLGWHLLLAWAFSTAAAAAAYARLRRGIEGALGIVLGGLGLRLIAAG